MSETEPDIPPPMSILSIPLPKATQIKFGDMKLPLEEVSLKKMQEITNQRNNVLMSIENCGAELAINHIQNYLPSLFSLIDAVEKLPTEYSKYGTFDFSWSSCIGTSGDEKKRVVKNFYYEVTMMLLSYGLCYRKKAIEILKDSNSNSKFDNNSKEISNALCIAAGIFEYIPTYLVQWGEEASPFPFPEQYKSTYDMLSNLCIAEAQMVTVKKAFIKNMSIGNVAKLSKGVRTKIGHCLDSLHEISTNYKVPLEKIRNFVFVYLTYNSFMFNGLTEKYLALDKYSSSKYGHSISCLNQGVLYLDKPKPELDTYDLQKLWESFGALKVSIQNLLDKYSKENEMIYYETIPPRNDVEDAVAKFLNTTSAVSFLPPDHPDINIVVKESMCIIL